jgi:outer membrane beta-barrel protein
MVLAAALAVPATVMAEEEEPGQLAAVQRRKFRMDHEIFLAAELQPLDAFYKGVGPVAGYTLHFTDVLAWEILRGGYSFRLKTGLRDQLEKDFGVLPTKFEELEWYVGTAAMITPFYGKLSLINRAVTHAEMFILVGATVGKFTDAYKPGPQAGLGLRFFLSEWISVRFDFRYHYLVAKKPTQVIDLALGLCFNLGGTD